jgi:hypothetical protein
MSLCYSIYITKGVHTAVAKAIGWELLLRVQSLDAALFVEK